MLNNYVNIILKFIVYFMWQLKWKQSSDHLLTCTLFNSSSYLLRRETSLFKLSISAMAAFKWCVFSSASCSFASNLIKEEDRDKICYIKNINHDGFERTEYVKLTRCFIFAISWVWKPSSCSASSWKLYNFFLYSETHSYTLFLLLLLNSTYVLKFVSHNVTYRLNFYRITTSVPSASLRANSNECFVLCTSLNSSSNLLLSFSCFSTTFLHSFSFSTSFTFHSSSFFSIRLINSASFFANLFRHSSSLLSSLLTSLAESCILSLNLRSELLSFFKEIGGEGEAVFSSREPSSEIWDPLMLLVDPV